MEKLEKVESYKVHKMCDNCTTGELLFTGQCYMTYPSKYGHMCISCGYKQTFDASYPRVEHRVVTEGE